VLRSSLIVAARNSSQARVPPRERGTSWRRAAWLERLLPASARWVSFLEFLFRGLWDRAGAPTGRLDRTTSDEQQPGGGGCGRCR